MQKDENIIENDQPGLREALEGLPGWAHELTERDEKFWLEQRSSIWSRISAVENQRAQRAPILAFALTAAIMAVCGWLLERPLMVTPPSAVYPDPDHELLLEVERMVQIDGPLALEPAGLLAAEMVQDLPARNYPVRKKEANDEN
jgi:hypothetical protein